MDDLISRQTAISAICNACGKIDCDKMDKCEKLQLPPANCSEFPNNSDTISRQAAIGIVEFECGEWRGLASTIVKAIEQLPSAQPTVDAVPVIRCKDCIHYDDWDTCDRFGEEMTVDDDGFCMWAERKEE